MNIIRSHTNRTNRNSRLRQDLYISDAKAQTSEHVPLLSSPLRRIQMLNFGRPHKAPWHPCSQSTSTSRLGLQHAGSGILLVMVLAPVAHAASDAVGSLLSTISALAHSGQLLYQAHTYASLITSWSWLACLLCSVAYTLTCLSLAAHHKILCCCPIILSVNVHRDSAHQQFGVETL